MNKRDRIKRARKGGKATAGITSERKAAASRANGRKRKMHPEIARIMQERGCSRQRAHVIFKKCSA